MIEEVGPGVRGFKKGMRVVALNSAPCGMCFFCSKHQENLCEDLLFNNGAYAEYIRVPRRIVETNMLAIPPHVTFEDAAMTEPLACVLRGLHETASRLETRLPSSEAARSVSCSSRSPKRSAVTSSPS